MGIFSDRVTDFLTSRGFHCEHETPAGLYIPDGIETFLATSSDGLVSRRIVLISPEAKTDEEAARLSAAAWKAVSMLKDSDGIMPLILTEDRWNTSGIMSQERLLAHMEIFFPIYARNCEVRRIDKKTAAEFLEQTHSYGDASCKFRYGLFLKRHTGHIAAGIEVERASHKNVPKEICPGTLVAAATFSNARKWIKGDKVIRSYEWTRYASLPGLRVNGGMGKLLKAFIKDVSPDDIMSYADLEWSEGKVYEQLGFRLEGYKDPVCFRIDTNTWQRSVHRGQKLTPQYTLNSLAESSDKDECAQRYEEMTPEHNSTVFFRNFGSAKYRLKLTEYE